MADLEEEGYLEQPHTSAGRKPSDKAYRLYVDTWMKVSTLNQEEIGFVQQYLNAKVSEVNNVVEATAQALSDMTNLTSLVLVPQLDRFELKRIHIVKIAQDKALVVLVFSSGTVKDVLISVPADIEEAYLENISNWLTSMAVGKRLDEALSEVRGAAAGELGGLSGVCGAASKRRDGEFAGTSQARSGVGWRTEHLQPPGISGYRQGAALFGAAGNEGYAV